MTTKNSWYTITAKADEDAEVCIYNEIGGWGITAEAFKNELGKIKAKNITLHINSPGGECFEAFAIFNALRDHPARIVAHVDGLAASAASIIMLAGDEIRIAANGFVMIHEARGGVWGDSEDMKRYAGLLDKLNKSLAKSYAKKTGQTSDEMATAMKNETWYDAQEAVDAGLVDFINEEEGDLPESAASAVAKYKTTPETLRRVAAMYVPNPSSGQSDKPAPEGAGAKAATILEKPMTLDAFKAFAAENPSAVAAYIEQGKKTGDLDARERAKAIRAACAGNDGLALDTFIAGRDASDAAAAVAAVAKARTDADATIAAQAKEIDKLKAQIGTQGAIGTAGAIAEAAKEAPGKPDESDHKAVAEWEWANEKDKAKGFTSKERFVAFRTQELKGTMKVFHAGQR